MSWIQDVINPITEGARKALTEAAPSAQQPQAPANQFVKPPAAPQDIRLCQPTDIRFARSDYGQMPYLDQGMYEGIKRFQDEAAKRNLKLTFDPPFRTPEVQALMDAKNRAAITSHEAGLGGDINSINGLAHSKWSKDVIDQVSEAAAAAGLRPGRDFVKPKSEPWHVDQWALTNEQRKALIDQAQKQYQAGNIPFCPVPARR